MVKGALACIWEVGLMRRLLVAVSAMLAGCVLLVTACSGSSSTVVSVGEPIGASGGRNAMAAVTVPEGWVVFESERVSLALPASFEGGVPTDEDVAAILDAMAEIDPSILNWEEALAGVDVELLIFGEPDVNGDTPVVAVQREVMPSGMSMQRYVDSHQQAFPESDLEIVSMTDDEARIVETYPDWEGFTTAYWVQIREGSYMYSVMYQADSESFLALESVFMTSGETIVVKE
jgi:hypothetical protein